MEPLKIGIIGLDTSHVTAFTELLHAQDHPYHVPGGKVVVAYPGGSKDFELSANRVAQYTDELRSKYDVGIVERCSDVARACDAILLESVDGRVHPEQLAEVVPYGKPIFVDKPFALSSKEADAMVEMAHRHGTPIMSTSALRYAQPFVEATSHDPQAEGGQITGCDAYGPMAIEPTQPGLFWYGIHTAEILFAALGKDCLRVRSVTNEKHDIVIGEWANGRIGTIRGNRTGSYHFGALVHRESTTRAVDISGSEKPFYASLLEEIIRFFRTKASPIDEEETKQVIRFIECANESRVTGSIVEL